jgi:hypothetical protein
MSPLVPVLAVLALCADPLREPTSPDPQATPRKPHPLAPSLPLLTTEEEDKLDKLIDRFIEADTGMLKGPEAKEAMEAFRKLGPEATFALIRGMNKSAAINHSCPAVTIARKLTGILGSTRDTQLLEFARDNIGAGVGETRHGAVLKDLKFSCTLRKNALERSVSTPELRGFPR